MGLSGAKHMHVWGNKSKAEHWLKERSGSTRRCTGSIPDQGQVPWKDVYTELLTAREPEIFSSGEKQNQWTNQPNKNP